MCLQAPKMAHSHFCSQTCVDDAESKGPMILEVPAGHSTFKSGTSPDLDSSSCFSDLRSQWLINSKHLGGMDRLAHLCGAYTRFLRLQPRLQRIIPIGTESTRSTRLLGINLTSIGRKSSLKATLWRLEDLKGTNTVAGMEHGVFAT